MDDYRSLYDYEEEELYKHYLYLQGKKGGVRLNWSNRVLNHVNLYSKKLSYGIFVNTDFKYSNLSFSKLSYSNLTNTNLYNTNIHKVSFKDSILTNTNFTSCVGEPSLGVEIFRKQIDLDSITGVKYPDGSIKVFTFSHNKESFLSRFTGTPEELMLIADDKTIDVMCNMYDYFKV